MTQPSRNFGAIGTVDPMTMQNPGHLYSKGYRWIVSDHQGSHGRTSLHRHFFGAVWTAVRWWILGRSK